MEKRVVTSALFGTVLADVTDAQTLKMCEEGDVNGCLNAIKTAMRREAHEMHVHDQDSLLEGAEGGFPIALGEDEALYADDYEELKQRIEERAETMCDIMHGPSNWQTLYTVNMPQYTLRESDFTPAISQRNGNIHILIFDPRTQGTQWRDMSPKSRTLLFTHISCLEPAD
jgi:hypothetical protein